MAAPHPAAPPAKPSKRADTDLAPIVAELQAADARSQRAIAAGLNERGVSTPRGVGKWQAGPWRSLLARLPG
jgi:hypothetical protein